MTNDTVVGRKASDFLLPGYSRGFHCAQCNRELQLSPRGALMVADGARLLCNTCGLDEAKLLKDKPTIVLSSMAKAQLEVMEEQANKAK